MRASPFEWPSILRVTEVTRKKGFMPLPIRHRVLDHAGDDGEDGAARAAANQLSDDRADIEALGTGQCRNERADRRMNAKLRSS